jgi:hypothetical protein
MVILVGSFLTTPDLSGTARASHGNDLSILTRHSGKRRLHSDDTSVAPLLRDAAGSCF